MEDRITTIYQRVCNRRASLLSTDDLEDASFAFSEFVQAKSQNEKFKRDFLALDAFAELVVKNFLLDRRRQLKRLRETPLYSVDLETGEGTPLEFADERDSPEIEALKREGWIGLRVVDPHLTGIDIKVLQLKFEGYTTQRSLNR